MSAFIVARKNKSGTSFHVRYRLGGRGFKPFHAGTFPTLKAAKVRRDFVLGELAANRNPLESLELMRREATVARSTQHLGTFANVAAAWLAGRVDVRASTRTMMTSRQVRLDETFGKRVVSEITTDDIKTWVAAEAEAGRAPGTIKGSFHQLRAILDDTLGDDNPARSDRIKLPRQDKAVLTPPSAAEFALILEHLPKRWRLATRVLEDTGLRAGELASLCWDDVDLRASRFRVGADQLNGGRKTTASLRWVPCSPELLAELVDGVSYDEREGRLFPDVTATGLTTAMRRACKAAGIVVHSPHDLRHRRISLRVNVLRDPIANVAQEVGHSNPSMTLDRYTHVMIDEALVRKA